MSGGISGGCQCGAIRYRLSGPLLEPGLCHCRMCQKASGNLFMAMVGSMLEHFEVTRGEPGWFRSSAEFDRGFCANCGAPMFFRKIGGKGIGVALGSLDNPAAIRPLAVYGTQSRMPWLAEVCAMDGKTTADEYSATPGLHDAIGELGYQHPDHDTERLPPNKVRQEQNR